MFRKSLVAAFSAAALAAISFAAPAMADTAPPSSLMMLGRAPAAPKVMTFGVGKTLPLKQAYSVLQNEGWYPLAMGEGGSNSLMIWRKTGTDQIRISTITADTLQLNYEGVADTLKMPGSVSTVSLQNYIGPKFQAAADDDDDDADAATMLRQQLLSGGTIPADVADKMFDDMGAQSTLRLTAKDGSVIDVRTMARGATDVQEHTAWFVLVKKDNGATLGGTGMGYYLNRAYFNDMDLHGDAARAAPPAMPASATAPSATPGPAVEKRPILGLQ